MNRIVLLLCPVALLVLATGCDQAELPPSLDPALSSKITALTMPLLAGDQSRDRDRLMDGSCDGDSSQYRYGGVGGIGGGAVDPAGADSGGIGGGQGDQLRLRDGSCGDGG